MTSFDDREKSYERKFALDEELQFKATARRNKLLGLWAAEKMGLSGDEAQAYARQVVKADLEEPGEEDVFRKIRGDFDGCLQSTSRCSGCRRCPMARECPVTSQPGVISRRWRNSMSTGRR